MSDLLGRSEKDNLSLRKQQLYDKQACCSWCGSRKYHKNGKDKGSQRFKYMECERAFTEYTGTWLDGLHKKSLVVEYIGLMIEGKSLDKISKDLNINKKTAFDRCHKILFSLSQDSGDEMKGIV